MVELDRLAVAQAALIGRADVSDTRRIIESQQRALSRRLELLEPALAALATETAPFGISVGAFPVDELRKPFWDDWGQPRSGGRRHQGNDFLAQIGIPMRAIEDGYFESRSSGGLGGIGIFLVGDSGARYFYAHLDSAVEFDENERVYAGQPIGTVGDTGNARGAPHLHLQIAPDGETGWENPFPLLDVLYGDGTVAADTIAVDDEVENADANLDIPLSSVLSATTLNTANVNQPAVITQPASTVLSEAVGRTWRESVVARNPR